MNDSSFKNSLAKLKKFVEPINRSKRQITFLIIAVIYGLLFMRIQMLNSQQPSTTQVSAQTNPALGAHIDKHLINQLRQLSDNSVSVQALFNTERNNPFQE